MATERELEIEAVNMSTIPGWCHYHKLEPGMCNDSGGACLCDLYGGKMLEPIEDEL